MMSFSPTPVQSVYAITLISVMLYGFFIHDKKLPNITSFRKSNDVLTVSWRSRPNNLYYIQTTTNLLDQNWYTIGVATGEPGNTSSKIITISNDHVCIYRVKEGIETKIQLGDCDYEK